MSDQTGKKRTRALLVCALLAMLILAVILSPEMQRRMKAGSEEQFADEDKLVWVAPGEYRMGSPKPAEDAAHDEGPVRMVRITKGFWLGKYEVTQEQYERVMGNNPSFFRGSERPVEQVSWDDAVQFCAKLTSSNSGSAYRLPTEAEWEYACRAGTAAQFHTGNSDSDLARAGWYYGNSGLMTHSVGEKEANAWGLHDMHGNVWEWCSDWYSSDYYGTRSHPDIDPPGPSSGSFRVGRGGSWDDEAEYCRGAYRENGMPSYRSYYVGFRVALETRGEAGALGDERTFDGIEFVWIPAGEFWMGSERTFDGIRFAWIPAGEFRMGSPSPERGRDDNEGPVHTVQITKGFWMGKFEVTQEQYERVMGSNPSHFKGANRPVEKVSWEDAVEFCRKLSRTGYITYRLPTEAEWEYACRAGATTLFYTGDYTTDLGQAGWYVGNSGYQTHEVGGKAPNAWNLYDIHGNVWEWCSDWYGKDYYGRSPDSDPTGPITGSHRVGRGGGWSSHPGGCRSAFRISNTPGSRDSILGFRLVAEMQGEEGALGEAQTFNGIEPVSKAPGDLTMGSQRLEATRASPAFKAANAARIQLKSLGSESVLERDDTGTWVVPDKGNYPADAQAIQRMLEAVETMDKGTVVSRNPEKQALYEVDERLGTEVLFLDKDGNELAHFFVGKAGQDFFSTNIRLAGSNEVRLVGKMLSYMFKRPGGDWRDRLVFDMEEDKIVKYSVRGNQGAVVLQKSEQGIWSTIEPATDQGKAAREDLERAVSGFAKLRASGFGEEDEKEKFELDKPKWTITATTDMGEELTLRICGERSKAQFYVRRVNRDAVFYISKYQVEKLTKPYFEILGIER